MNCLSIAVRLENKVICFEYDISHVSGASPLTIQYRSCDDANELLTTQVSTGETITVCSSETPTLFAGSGTVDINKQGKCGELTSTGAYEYLDLDDSTELRRTVVPTSIVHESVSSDSYKLQFSYNLDMDLPKTAKNIRLLNSFINPNIIGRSTANLPVYIFRGEVMVSDNFLRVSEKGDKFVASTVFPLDHWTTQSAALFLNTLDLPDYTFTYANIETTNTDAYPYDEANGGVYFPIHDFGEIYKHSSGAYIQSIQYLRPYFYVKYLLEVGFKQMGYKFESTLFDSAYGNRLMAYLIDKDYGVGLPARLLHAKRTVEVGYALSDYPIGATKSIAFIAFPNEVADANNNFNAAGTVYEGIGEVTARGLVKISNVESGYFPQVALAKVNVDEAEEVHIIKKIYADQRLGGTTRTDILEFEFEVPNISLPGSYDLVVMVSSAGPRDGNPSRTLSILEGSFLEVEGYRKYLDLGDTIPLNEFLRKDLTFLDFIKGISQVLNLRWEEDEANRVVRAFPSHNVEILTEAVEGYHDDTVYGEVDEYIEHSTDKVLNDERTQPRYIELAFKESTDEAITKQSLNTRLWSKKIDLGDSFVDKTTETRHNEFFEPTINLIGGLLDRERPYVPTSRKEEVEHTWDIEPRLVLNYGKVTHDLRSEDGGPADSPEIRFSRSGANTTLIPTAAQAVIDYVRFGNTHNDALAGFTHPLDNVIFGINDFITQGELLTLYDWFHKIDIKESLQSISIEYLVNLTVNRFKQLSLRKYYFINYLGRTIKARINKISDFNYCRKVTTPVTFVPDVQEYDLQGLVSNVDPEQFVCNNAPVLLCSYTGPTNCYLFTLAGINNSVIDTVAFLISTDAGVTYSPLANDTAITASNCSSTEFWVKAVVYYEGDCEPKTTPVKIVNPCPTVVFNGECEWSTYQPPDGDLQYFVKPVIVSDSPLVGYTINSIQHCVWDNVGETCTTGLSDWEEGDGAIYVETFRKFFAEIQIQDCPVQNIEWVCEAPVESPPPPNCETTDLTLECVDGPGGSKTFSYSGFLPFFIQHEVTIKYRASDDGIAWSDWKLWQGENVYARYINAALYVDFCDDECPRYCTEITCGEQETCEPFNPGTPINRTFYNNGEL